MFENEFGVAFQIIHVVNLHLQLAVVVLVIVETHSGIPLTLLTSVMTRYTMSLMTPMML